LRNPRNEYYRKPTQLYKLKNNPLRFNRVILSKQRNKLKLKIMYRINQNNKISYCYNEMEFKNLPIINFKTQNKTIKLILIDYIRKHYYNASIRDIINNVYSALATNYGINGVVLKL
jgi:hypothetical protein